MKIPSILHNIVGKKFYFYLKLTSYNTVQGRKNYAALKLQEVIDADLPQETTSKPLEETKGTKNGSHTKTQLQNSNSTIGNVDDEMSRKTTRTYNKRKEKIMANTENTNKTKNVKKVMEKESQVAVVNKMLNKEGNKEKLKANTAKNNHSTTTLERKEKAKKLNINNNQGILFINSLFSVIYFKFMYFK